MIDKVRQAEFIAFIILNRTAKIHGIKMSTLCKHVYVFLLRLVYLATFKNLQAYRSVGIVRQEWTSTWLSYIFYNTTNSHGSIEFFAKIDSQFISILAIHSIIGDTQCLPNEFKHICQFVNATITTIKSLQIFKNLLLYFHENASQDILVNHSIFFKSVWNDIVYVLDKHNI